jgi:two-component system, sensor histidine kinase PdtaS
MGAEVEHLFLLAARSRGLPVWARYGTTTLLVLICLGLQRWILGPEPRLTFLLLYFPIILAGLLFNRGTGIYATALGALCEQWLLIRQVGSPANLETSDFVTLLVFLIVGLFTAFLVEALHVALRSLATERASLAEANRELLTVAEQRGTLLSEAVHRAANDLQRLAGTLRLQANATDEFTTQSALREAADRVAAVGRINARLDRHRDDGYAEVDSRGFLDGLVKDLCQEIAGLRPIMIVSAAEAHMISMARAVPIAMIVNELVSNALKYAFPDEQEGKIDVAFRREGEDFVLTVSDDGVGFDPAAVPKGSGLGTGISRSLAGQLGGHLEAVPQAPGSNQSGTRWVMRFPAEN